MSIRFGVTTITIVATTLLLSSVPGLQAQEGETSLTTTAMHKDTAPTKGGCPFQQAPIGHRQPRPSEMSEPVHASPTDIELRRLDAEINRKLIICRGC